MPVTSSPGRYGKPLPAVILAVDTARRSGWAVRVRGQHAASGEVDTLESADVSAVVAWSTRVARRAGLPLVLVLEAPFGGPVAIIASLGAARERWLVPWRSSGHTELRVVRVQPSTWRAAVLGSNWSRAERDRVREHEQRVAQRMLGGVEVGADEAAAVLIGVWAERARSVGVAAGVDV